MTPPPSPPKNIQEQYFVNGIQWQLSFNTQNIYISQTILFRGLHLFFMRWGGVKILWYNILTPPSTFSKIWRNNFRILALCRYDKSTIITYISSFLFKVSRGGSKYYRAGQNITVIFWPAGHNIMTRGSLFRRVKILYDTGTVTFFLWKKIQPLWIDSNFTCMFLMMIPLYLASLM